ncbi:Bug family tripartite tricarboxylate transporter substrate binding protein [Roseitranquillus sediminis]|uniref:Bug family tripartite tricarboxylate transporter substrate binding protein n=1 Tax=Roseitranquillus sediminis TaxID=2809051 RepID=UPI001D0C6BAB|nr:tripartite tricarboxylate transporter substrate binding protein [Roseitranquillus sediminis]MBM9595420.1 tripartite tricarboxylate transporter substrate binding protein [Roseitranquillus sediminis]
MPLKSTMTAVATIALSATFAQAQDHANVELPGTIRVIVAYSAGGSSDTLARVTIPAWEAELEELTGQSVSTVIANMPGAGGEIGWTNLANAEPDGSTIGIINLPAVPIVGKARDAAYSPWIESFAPIGVNVIDPNVVMLANSSEYETLDEAIAAAKEDPGSVTVGADGPLSDDHVAMYQLQRATDAEFAFIPFSGTAPAMRAFLSGEVDIAIGNTFDYLTNEQGAKDAFVLRAERYDFIPDVPTIEEAMGVGPIPGGSTRGFAAPAGTPGDILAVYREALANAYADEEVVAEMREANITTVEPLIGEEFGAEMQSVDQLAEELIPLFRDGGYLDN